MLGAAFGALFALDLNDRLGRLVAWRLACVLWASGIFMQVFSSGIYGLLLFARIWSGLGAGVLTVAAPMYLSEIAPARTRGLVVSVYMVILLAMLAMGSCCYPFRSMIGSRSDQLQGSSSITAPVSTWRPPAPSTV